MQQWKIILAISSLVAIGFLGGFFTHRLIMKKTITKVRELNAPPGFQRHLLERIDATPEQEDQLHPIIFKYGRQIAEVGKESREKRRKIINQMHEEIKPHLTEEQIQRLDRFSRRFKRDRDHPPHEGPPPGRERRHSREKKLLDREKNQE